MKKSETIKITDIAREANVSTATVSRVFSRHPYVSEEIRKRVLELAKSMDYAPQVASTQGTFAIMAAGIDGFNIGAYEMGLIFSISKKLFEGNYGVQILSEHSIPYLHKNSFKAIISINPSVSRLIRAITVPSISINEPVEGMHFIGTDHKHGIEMAVDYLAAKNHRKIAYICGEKDNWGSAQREMGYRNGLKKHSLPVDESMIVKFRYPNEIIGFTGYLLKKSPTALIIEGEGYGTIINYTMYVLNKKIPDDISVIAFEDNLTSQYMTPPLTTINQDLLSLGTLAAEKAIEMSRVRNKIKEPLNIVIKNKLIERMSVKSPLTQ